MCARVSFNRLKACGTKREISAMLRTLGAEGAVYMSDGVGASAPVADLDDSCLCGLDLDRTALEAATELGLSYRIERDRRSGDWQVEFASMFE